MITLTLDEWELRALRIGWRVALRAAAPRHNGAEFPARFEVLTDKLATATDTGSADETTLDGPATSVRPSQEIDVRTAAERLGISEQAVRKRISAGTLPARKVGQRTWLVEWSEESTRD